MGIEKELLAFLQAIFAGNMVCLVYDALRIWRRILRHNLWIIALEDILFWVWTSIHIYVRIFQTCDGIIRWYFVVGTIVGGILTYCIMEKILKKYVADSKKTR